MSLFKGGGIRKQMADQSAISKRPLPFAMQQLVMPLICITDRPCRQNRNQVSQQVDSTKRKKEKKEEENSETLKPLPCTHTRARFSSRLSQMSVVETIVSMIS